MNDTDVQILEELLKKKFSLPITFNCGDLTISPAKADTHAVLSILKSDPEFDFNMLIDVTVIDWVDARTERFEVVYQLLSLTKHRRLTVRTFVAEQDATIRSVYDLWRGANFMEREAYDMFGITFEGHPDLRRLHMYEEFKGHPLRKDYPLQLKQPRVALRAPEVSNTARLMVRPDLVSIGAPARKAERPAGANPIIGERK